MGPRRTKRLPVWRGSGNSKRAPRFRIIPIFFPRCCMVWSRLFAIAIGLSLALAAKLISADPPPVETLVLQGALIRTQTDAGDFVGTIVIRDGKIVAVGPKVAAPAGAEVLDV